MIYKEGEDLFAIRTVGGEIDLQLTGAELRARLHDTGLWLREQIDRVLAMEVGESTRRPTPVRIPTDQLDAEHVALGRWRAEEEHRDAIKRKKQTGFWRYILNRHMDAKVREVLEELPALKSRVVRYRDCFGVARYDFTDPYYH